MAKSTRGKNVYKRGDIWYVDVKINGKRVRKPSGPDKNLAEQEVVALKKRAQGDKLGYTDIKPITIEAFFDYCLNTYKTDLDPKSHLRYENHAKNFKVWLKKEFSAVTLVTEITPAMMGAFKAAFKVNHKYVTVNACLVFIKQCFKLCRKDKVVDVNPAEFTTLYAEDIIDDQKGHVILDGNQKRGLVGAAKGIYKKIFFTMLNTGLRRGEATKIEWSKHIRFGEGSIAIGNRVITFKLGAIFISKEIGKKGHERVIPMNEAMLEMLKELPKTSRFVFPSVKGGKLKDDLINRAIISAAKKAEIQNLTKPHDLRHTFSTYIVNDLNIPLPVAQQILGHKDIKTTMGYQHIDSKHMQDAVDKIKF